MAEYWSYRVCPFMQNPTQLTPCQPFGRACHSAQREEWGFTSVRTVETPQPAPISFSHTPMFANLYRLFENNMSSTGVTYCDTRGCQNREERRGGADE
eukprot:416560-Prorocentrum_minimum.AAC.4